LRFEQQIDKPLPKSIPINPQTLGEHIRMRRMELRLFQRDIAAILNVSEDCIGFANAIFCIFEKRFINGK